MSLPKPYYDDGRGIVIYHCNILEITPQLSGLDCFIADPVYGINGGVGKTSIERGKGNYEGNHFSDTPEYVSDVCVPIIKFLIGLGIPGAVTPGNRCLMSYPQPNDVGCFFSPASVGNGPWGFVTMNPILYYGKNPHGGLGSHPTGMILNESSEDWGHPCIKPIKAWTWLINKVSKSGHTILDPFMGSGTTLRAAKDLGRKAIGIELEEKYCEIAANRLRQEVLEFA